MRLIKGQLKSIISKSDLIRYLVRHDLKTIYSHKVFGFLWTLLDPLFMMLVYIVLVVVIFKRGSPKYPILLFSALLAWQWFISSLTTAVTCITSKARLIQTIYFPKITLPMTRVIVGLIEFLLGLVVLIPLLFIFEASFSWNLLWLPVLIIVQFFLTFGLALICATLGVYFRDLENIIVFVLRVCFYLSPVLYSVGERIPERFVQFYMLNPFAALFESYKNIMVRGLPPSEYMLFAAASAALSFVLGIIIFSKKESEFAKDV